VDLNAPANANLVPLVSVYNNARKEAHKATMKADFLQSRTLGDVQRVSLADSDGVADASEAAKQAQAAVNGVEGAKKAMETAASMLAAAETAAQQSKQDAAQSVEADSHDMANIVRKAVRAAQSAEGLKIESLKKERETTLEKQNMAYQHAVEELDRKRDETIELGDADIEQHQDKLRTLEASSHANRVKAIADRMQNVASPQKLAALKAELMVAMGQSPTGDVGEAKSGRSKVSRKTAKALAAAAKLPVNEPSIGEALPSKESQDEKAFDAVLSEMKHAEGKLSQGTSVADAEPIVATAKLEALADDENQITSTLAAPTR